MATPIGYLIYIDESLVQKLKWKFQTNVIMMSHIVWLIYYTLNVQLSCALILKKKIAQLKCTTNEKRNLNEHDDNFKWKNFLLYIEFFSRFD